MADRAPGFMNKELIKATNTKTLAVLGPEDGVQLMLSAQMFAVHDLQQKMAFYAAVRWVL